MSWKIALCDDEADVCNQLKSYLDRFCEDTKETMSLSVFHSAESLLHSEQAFDIYLLDIQMGEMSGMSAARELRRRGSNAIIFFITSMTHYAIEGYEVHAFSFLVKPLLYELFSARLLDAIRALRKSVGQSLQFISNSGIIHVNSNEIIYVESFRHEIRMICLNFTFTQSELSLSALESKLVNCGFFRVHKSYLINMRNIRIIGEREIEMINGDKIALSKYRRREFLSSYATYRKEHL